MPCAAIRARLSTVLQPHCGGLQPGRAPPLVRAGSPALEAVAYHPPMAATTSQAVSALPFTGKLSLRDAIDRGLQYNLGPVGLSQILQHARGQSKAIRSALLPNITGTVSEVSQRRIGSLDAGRIAAMDPATLEEAFRRRPALHRFPGSMARRTQELCAALVRDYGGDPSRVWNEARDGRDLKARLLGLPGIGEMKAATLVAILTRRLGVRPPGWEDVLPKHPTLGDVDSPEALTRYQEGKRAHKAEMRAQQAGSGRRK